MKTGAENGKGTTGECPVCEKKFRRKSTGQTYCGRSCAASGRNNFNKNKTAKTGKKAPRYCAVCGLELSPDRGSAAKYCDKECAEIGRQSKNAAARKADMEKGRNCIVCGKWFIPQNSKDRICSEECSQSANAECTIRIRKAGAGLRPDMQPKVGQIYKATRCLNCNGNGKFYIVPGFGKFGVIIKHNEAEEITTA